jgi:Major capsid protein Gp23.
MSQELLESRWDETKDALMEGLKGSRRNTMGVILENTRRYLKENASSGSTVSGNIATLNRVILPVIRRVMPTVIANEIVGVQPMTGPVGQIHTLRVRYASTMTDQSAAATSVTAGEEALSPFKIATAYSAGARGACQRCHNADQPHRATPVLPLPRLRATVVVRSPCRS